MGRAERRRRMKLEMLSLVLTIFVAQAPLLAQATKTGGSSGSSSPSSAPRASVDPAKMMHRDLDTLHKTGQAGDRLTGNVTVTGGSVPWDPITVAVVCDGKEKYTKKRDGKVFFANNRADEGGGNRRKEAAKRAGWHYVGCKGPAAWRGFTSRSGGRGSRRPTHNKNSGSVRFTIGTAQA